MTLIYPNIVPENNLRLPDALTIKHGPAASCSPNSSWRATKQHGATGFDCGFVTISASYCT